MKTFAVSGHEYSLLPEGSEWKLAWADEFDGTELDRSKWDFRLNFWGKPFAAYTDQGVVLDGNSHVELHRTQRDGYYVSAQLQTGSNSFDIPKTEAVNPWKQTDFWPLGELPEPKFQHLFGYYECRCRFQQEPEVMWSAFWTQSPSIGAAYDPAYCGVESDIMECFRTGTATTGNIMGGYGKQFREEGRVKYALAETPDGFHRFGMDWSPEGYVFYCDGREVSRTSETVSLVPQFILLTTEVKGYRSNEPVPVGDTFIDDAFIVDYVRVFDRAE